MELSKILDKKLLDKLKSGSTFKGIAKDTADMVRVRVRKGFGVAQSKGNEKKFKELKSSTIKARTRMKKRGELLSGEGVGRSNLTATGEMTDSITGKSSKGTVEVYLDGKRNQDLSAYHEIKGRPFFHISKKEYNKVYNLMRAKITEILRKN